MHLSFSSFSDVVALPDVPFISWFSAVRPTMPSLVPIQSSTSFSQYLCGHPLFLWTFTFPSSINFYNVCTQNRDFTCRSTRKSQTRFESIMNSDSEFWCAAPIRRISSPMEWPVAISVHSWAVKRELIFHIVHVPRRPLGPHLMRNRARLAASGST